MLPFAISILTLTSILELNDAVAPVPKFSMPINEMLTRIRGIPQQDSPLMLMQQPSFDGDGDYYAADGRRKTSQSPDGRFLLNKFLSGFMLPFTLTTTVTFISTFECTKSTTACAGRRRRHSIETRERIDADIPRIEATSVQMKSAPSIDALDFQHLNGEKERQSRLFQHKPSNPFEGFDLVRHAMLMQQQQQPELEPSGHYYFNDDWSGDFNGQQHESINREYEMKHKLPRPTVTRTAIVSIVRTQTSTVSCSTAGILPQCQLIGFGS